MMALPSLHFKFLCILVGWLDAALIPKRRYIYIKPDSVSQFLHAYMKHADISRS